MIVAKATKDTAEPKRIGLDIILPLAFGLCSHAFEFRHVTEQMIERIGDQLLRRAGIDRASEPQLEMAFGIQPQRERGLGLAARSRAHRRRAARDWRQERDRFRFRFRCRHRFRFDFERRGGLVQFVERFLRLVDAKAVGDLGMLRVNRRVDRSQAGGWTRG